MQSSTLGLLIGTNYYHDLILDESIQVHDVLDLIKSKLGGICSGRLSCSNSAALMEIAIFIMTQASTLLPLEVHHLPNDSAADIF